MVSRALLLGALAAAVLSAAGAPAAAAPAPSAPGPAAGFYAFTANSDLHGTSAVADRAAGFDVWIGPRSPHRSRIAAAIDYAVGQLTRYGIDVRYRGIAPADPPARPGVIAVTEATSATSRACLRPSSADSGAVTEAVAYPSFQDVGIATRIDAGDVTFCPSVWSGDHNYLVAVALHEMGHAVGLGHFPDRYQGRTQVMNPIVPDVQTYQAGDVNGLRYLVAETAVLRAQSIVSGSVESWEVRQGGLAVTGWAIVGRTSQFADIVVTRDGRSVYRITTNTPRPDIVQHYGSGWPNPGFTGARVPMADGTHRYCVVASAVSSAQVTLGCRSLGYPPPPATELSPLPALGRAPIEVWWTSTTAEVALGAGAAALLGGVVLVAVRRRRSRPVRLPPGS
jgi:hypothetical protein